jgi:TonB family protein
MSLKTILGCAGVLLFAAANAPAADSPGGLEVELGVPQVLFWVPPVYPKAAADKKLEGRVQVRFVVDETGAVTKARAVHSTNKVFDEAAVQSVLQWRFEPAVADGRNIAKCMDVLLPFQLADLKRAPESSFPPAKVVQTLAYSPYVRPAKVSGDDPDYPDSLLSRHLTGEVDVEFSLGADGQMQALKVLWATHADFIHPALAAAGNWRFRPAMQGDLAVAAPMQSALVFDVLDSVRVDMLAANGVTLADPPGSAYDQKPRLRVIVDPVYPYDLLIADTEGDAAADFVIGTNGRLESIVVREASQPGFGRALAAALDGWMFKPAQNADHAVAARAAVRWHFGVNSEGYQPLARLVQRVRNNDTADMGARGLDGALNSRYQISPVYPAALVDEKAAGEAQIGFIIDHDGRCRLARIISATREEFGWAAATAVERWVFDPPRRGGRPTDVRVTIPFHFSAPP